MNEQSEKWALIPSDPAVFDDMIQQYGIQDTTVQEVFSTDFEDFQDPNSVYGLMFISRYVEDTLPDDFETDDPLRDDIVFTAQVVTNVCGTLALLAVLLNANIDKGRILSNFLNFTEGFSPVNRGLCLGNSKEIREIHDAYARNANHTAENAVDVSMETTENDNVEYVDSDDFHYITYIYKNGYVWELDGLKEQPVKLQACNPNEWLVTVKPFIQKRMEPTDDNPLAFNLMAITKDSYHTMLGQKKIYENFIETVYFFHENRNITEIHRAKNNFLESVDPNIPHYLAMVDIWKTLTGESFALAYQKIDKFAELVGPFYNQVGALIAEKDKARADVVRQKWDYFPFIKQLFANSFQHELLNEFIYKDV